jgi:CubicO group peptidase (beta-lactamase class C family)
VLFSTLLVLFPVTSQASTDRERLASGVDSLFSEWNRPDGPGAAVLVSENGKTVLVRCYGSADLEHGIPIGPQTRFELASVSKSFTAFGVLLLEKEGKLSLGDDIQKHLPELPNYGRPITVADLLHHTSGISDWIRVLPYVGRYGEARFGVKELLELVARQRVLEFEPGSKWSYSNTNYALLAEIVARASGRPFGEYMREEVFEPLGMTDTSFPKNGACVLPNRANAYSKGIGGEYVRGLVERFLIPGPAHASSTVEDMEKWIDNLRTGALGGVALRDKMQTKPILSTGEQSFYGAGLGMGEYRGVRTVGHSGQTGAFKTETVYCPEVEVGVVVLGNAGWMQADALSRRVLDLYLQDELEPLPEVAARAESEQDEAQGDFRLDPAEYRRFLGGYRLETDPSTLVGVACEGEWLVGVIVGEGLDLFRPVAPYEFKNRNDNCVLTFSGSEGEGGTAERVLINLKGEEMWATRVRPALDDIALDDYAGFYYSDELQAVYEVVRDSEGFAVHCRNNEPRTVCVADTDVLAGAIGVLTFLRGESGRVVGFDFGEPEDLNERQIRFTKREECR